MAAAVITTMMAASCTPAGTPDGEWHTIAQDGWPYGNVLTFNQKGDTMAMDTLVLTVRHTADYPYSNLWLELGYNTADTVAVADTLNVILADDYGHWLGKGSGTSFQRPDTIVLRRHAMPGSQLRLRHVMRVDTLREIEQVGITYSNAPRP